MFRREVNIADDMKETDYEGVDFSKYGSYVLKWDLLDSNTIKPVEVKHRVKGLGLGAEPLKSEGDAVIGKSDERIEDMQSLYGSKIKVISGPNKGLKAILLEDLTSKEILYNMQRVKAEVQESGEVIYFRGDQIKLRKHKDKENSAQNQPIESSKSTSNIEIKPLKWVIEGIIVRIIGKSYQKGKYYLKKGVIVSIDSIYSFTIRLGNCYLTDVNEKEIETVIPTGTDDSKVKILSGEFRGETGIILENDQTTKEVIVQIELDVVKLKYSECSLVSNIN